MSTVTPGKRAFKLNVFDLLVILAIVIVVAAVGLKWINDKTAAKQSSIREKYIATLKISAVEPSLATYLDKDKRIYFDTDGYVNATIGEVRTEPASVVYADANGTAVRSEDPYLVDIFVDVLIDDVAGDALLKIGRYSVHVGGKLAIKTFYVYGEGVVVDIQKQ